MYYVYIIKSNIKGRYYIGSTGNIVARLNRHNKGGNKSTKYGIPWILVHLEEFETEQCAYRREMQIKSYKGGSAFKQIVEKI
jgi:putative endonuclease